MKSIDDNLAILDLTMELVDHSPPSSSDEGPFHVRPECALTQVALRGDGIFQGRLQIAKAFWSSATFDEQALLLIHEAAHSWFTETLPSEADDTKAIRQMIGLLEQHPAYLPKMSTLMRKLIETRAAVSDDEMRAVR